jgi:serine/threonine protein kinase
MGELRPGRVIAGKFRLDAPVGVGGMGEVWRATHLQLDVPVAVKFMDARAAASTESQLRFEREAKAAARLKSPHVVQVIDHGRDGDAPYIVMELLEGEDLSSRLRRSPVLPLPDVERIVTGVAKGLRRAHEAGIVHRDLKPGNVFLCSGDDEEVVKVLDFGVAKLEASAFGELAEGEHTQAGTVLGSPAYMSPEQVRGFRNLDHRADLWALAVIAFRCVTGQRPFEAGSLGDLVIKLCVDPLPRATERNPSLPTSLDAFFDQAFARTLEQRFASAVELARAFSAAVAVQKAAEAAVAYQTPRDSLPPPAEPSGPSGPSVSQPLGAEQAALPAALPSEARAPVALGSQPSGPQTSEPQPSEPHVLMRHEPAAERGGPKASEAQELGPPSALGAAAPPPTNVGPCVVEPSAFEGTAAVEVAPAPASTEATPSAPQSAPSVSGDFRVPSAADSEADDEGPTRLYQFELPAAEPPTAPPLAFPAAPAAPPPGPPEPALRSTSNEPEPAALPTPGGGPSAPEPSVAMAPAAPALAASRAVAPRAGGSSLPAETDAAHGSRGVLVAMGVGVGLGLCGLLVLVLSTSLSAAPSGGASPSGAAGSVLSTANQAPTATPEAPSSPLGESLGPSTVVTEPAESASVSEGVAPPQASASGAASSRAVAGPAGSATSPKRATPGKQPKKRPDFGY